MFQFVKSTMQCVYIGYLLKEVPTPNASGIIRRIVYQMTTVSFELLQLVFATLVWTCLHSKYFDFALKNFTD